MAHYSYITKYLYCNLKVTLPSNLLSGKCVLTENFPAHIFCKKFGAYFKRLIRKVSDFLTHIINMKTSKQKTVKLIINSQKP